MPVLKYSSIHLEQNANASPTVYLYVSLVSWEAADTGDTPASGRDIMKLYLHRVRGLTRQLFFRPAGYDKPSSHADYKANEVRICPKNTVNLCLILSFRFLSILASCQARRVYVNRL